ncbi:MAG TPA: hypothetical protein VMR33_19050 [Candidatus Baltobacteraceae bacterium]|nr:hypothetical protein [Candidatus Baltobacteraceae bacterium]
MVRPRDELEQATSTTPDMREEKMRSIFMQPGAAARAPKGRPRTTECNTRPEKFRRTFDEASNATLKAKGKRDGLPMVADRAVTRLPERTVRGYDSNNCVSTSVATAVRCIVKHSYSLWKDKAPALNFPKPEPKSNRGRNAAAVNGGGDAGALP